MATQIWKDYLPLDTSNHSAQKLWVMATTNKVGGKFTAWDGYISGRNLVLDDGKRIVQEWKTTEWPAGWSPSIVEFSFKEKGNGTELRLVHSNVPAGQAKSYAKGWTDFYWKPLREYFQRKSKQ